MDKTRQFRVCTIANNPHQYMEMKASFLQAGFDESQCRYRVFDNSLQNLHDPYGVINAVLAEASEPYVIFCHQDILIDQCDNFGSLVRLIKEMDVIDPNWAILGNAGVTEDHRVIRRLHDPFGNDCLDNSIPERVCSLDENFLVVKTSSGLRCSSGLKGFHLYATDLCLQALHNDFSCYVINFCLTHLSKGRVDESFQIARKAFQDYWSPHYTFRYVQTACTTIFLSRSSLLRWFFSSYRVGAWFFSSPRRHKLLSLLSDKTYVS